MQKGIKKFAAGLSGQEIRKDFPPRLSRVGLEEHRSTSSWGKLPNSNILQLKAEKQALHSKLLSRCGGLAKRKRLGSSGDSPPLATRTPSRASHPNLTSCLQDEYGGTTGLITLEDVLEEFFDCIAASFEVLRLLMPCLRIVGEIYDPDEEKDRVEKQQNRAKIQQWLCRGYPYPVSVC